MFLVGCLNNHKTQYVGSSMDADLFQLVEILDSADGEVKDALAVGSRTSDPARDDSPPYYST